ncbi:DNA helicase RecQ [Desulfococcaceae bacterium HSG7]|nr:DNA helicase RecQ [Desulfococcaceae bacterium HSG7]
MRTYFGYASFREHQKEIIHHIVEGGDAFVLMPTGSGKSLCYQIPGMLRKGVGIVVSPLIALMQDQTDALRQMDIRADYLNSSLSLEQIRETEQRVLEGHTDLLYVAPERLMTTAFQHFLKHIPIALFAIDEAHCISQWGHDFRPEYLQLALLIEEFPNVPRIALTATADSITRKEILEKLRLTQSRQFVSSFDRPNICYRVDPRQSGIKQLIAFLRTEHQGDSGLVYCLTRKNTESIAGQLNKMGFNALPYHAGMSQEMRAEHQRRFLREEKVIIVATIAFGMGIDKPDVRFVVHLGMPKTIEAYYQETGRAGRDGMPSDALMLYNLADVVMMRKIMAESGGDEQFKMVQHRKSEAMLVFCESIRCRRQMLLDYFGEELKNSCGNCDVCQGKVETYNGTVIAQKALSCVYRTGQRFGAGHLSDVLIGKATKKIRRCRHDRVSTFGIGKELSHNEWKAVYRQLAAAGFICTDINMKGGFYLAPQSRPVLKGEQTVWLRKEPAPVKLVRKIPKIKVRKLIFDEPVLVELWEKLRMLRLKIAQKANVPPYVVFHDTTLSEMVRNLPVSPDEMGALHGMGAKKMERYGDTFLAIICEHVQKHNLNHPEHQEKTEVPPKPDRNHVPVPESSNGLVASLSPTVFETHRLLQEGKTPEEIATERELKAPTIYNHIADLIECNLLSADEVITLQPDEVREIEDALRALPEEQQNALKPVFDKFNGKYDYELIRCIRSGLWATSDIVSSQPQAKPPKSSIQLICLAVSRKYAKYCVAGKELRGNHIGNWVRPVSSFETGELAIENILLPDEKLPALLDIISVPLDKPTPGTYQSENFMINKNGSWLKNGVFALSELSDLCDTPDSLWINGYSSGGIGVNDRIPQEKAETELSSSLLFIRPENLRIIVLETELGKRIRAEFTFNSVFYQLPVTDPAIDSIYLRKKAGVYPVNVETYCTLSIGEPFYGYCYKLVAGIFQTSVICET